MPPRKPLEKLEVQVRNDLVLLGDMVDQAIEDAITALKNRDMALARQVIVNDRLLNRVRFRVDEMCLRMLATQQPTATDLRVIIAAMNIVLDLERMGDHAANVAKIAIRMGDTPPLKPLIDIPYMAKICRNMLDRALSAYLAMDPEAARAIINDDEQVDQLYDQVFRELLTYMLEDDRTIKRAMHLLFIAHNLERIADRVTNICERVIYVKTGEMTELA